MTIINELHKKLDEMCQNADINCDTAEMLSENTIKMYYNDENAVENIVYIMYDIDAEMFVITNIINIDTYERNSVKTHHFEKCFAMCVSNNETYELEKLINKIAKLFN